MFKYVPIIIINLNKQEVFFITNLLLKKNIYLVQLYICETNEMNIHLESQGEINLVLQKWLILIVATLRMHSQ